MISANNFPSKKKTDIFKECQATQRTEPMKYREEGKINKLWHLGLANRYNYKKE